MQLGANIRRQEVSEGFGEKMEAGARMADEPF